MLFCVNIFLTKGLSMVLMGFGDPPTSWGTRSPFYKVKRHRHDTVSGSPKWLNGQCRSDVMTPMSFCLTALQWEPWNRNSDQELTRTSSQVNSVVSVDPNSPQGSDANHVSFLVHSSQWLTPFCRTVANCSWVNLSAKKEGDSGVFKRWN